MNGNRSRAMFWPSAAGLLACLLFAGAAAAQVGHEVIEDEIGEAEAYAYLSSGELGDLVAPIALYPDDLVSLVLPAATYPVQIVQAARFLEKREADASLAPQDDWDDAVVALLNYPEVIKMMNDDLDWTWALGEAFLNQQAEVMDAIGEFRDRAYAAGNLRSDRHQTVTRTREVIEIVPADPEVIYVPYYEPARVVIYQPYPVYFYHPYPRYSYYYPYPSNYAFSYGYFFGVTTAYRLHWSRRHLYTYHHWHHAHPYYGHGYHARHYFRHRPHYRRHPRHARSRGGYRDDPGHRPIWRPRPRHGSRPHDDSVRPGHRGRFAGSTSRGGRDHGADRPRRPRPHGDTAAGTHRQRPLRPRNAYTDTDPDMRQIIRRGRRSGDASQGRVGRPGNAHTSGQNHGDRPRHSLGERRPVERDAHSSKRRTVRFAGSGQGRLRSGPVGARPRSTHTAPERSARVRSSRPPVRTFQPKTPTKSHRMGAVRQRNHEPVARVPLRSAGAQERRHAGARPAPSGRAAPPPRQPRSSPPPRASEPPRKSVRAESGSAREHSRGGRTHRARSRRARP